MIFGGPATRHVIARCAGFEPGKTGCWLRGLWGSGGLDDAWCMPMNESAPGGYSCRGTTKRTGIIDPAAMRSQHCDIVNAVAR